MLAARASGSTRKANASSKIDEFNALKDDSPSDVGPGDHGLKNHDPNEGSLNAENADCRTNNSKGIRPILRVGIYDCIMISFEIMIIKKKPLVPRICVGDSDFHSVAPSVAWQLGAFDADIQKQRG